MGNPCSTVMPNEDYLQLLVAWSESLSDFAELVEDDSSDLAFGVGLFLVRDVDCGVAVAGNLVGGGVSSGT